MAEEARTGELSWGGVLRFLWPYRDSLVLCVIVITALSVWLAFALPNQYSADNTVVPVEHSGASTATSALGALAGVASLAGISLSENSTKQVAISTLDSRALIESLIRDDDLLPVLFARRWNAPTRTWVHSFLHPKDPTLLDGYLFFFKSVVSVKEDKTTGLVHITVRWTSPQLAQRWASELVRRTNEVLRQNDLDESEHRLEFLNEQALKTNDVDLKRAIYTLIQQELKQETIVRGSEQYAFRIVDPPVVPERKSSPNRVLIVCLGFVGGWLAGIALIVVRRKVPQLFAGWRRELSQQPG